MRASKRISIVTAMIAISLSTASSVRAQSVWPFNLRENRPIEHRDPSQLPPSHVPAMPPPATVSRMQTAAEPIQLSLDDAIRIALENAQVIRVLSGVSAVNAGVTIYDPAIANTRIDAEMARFDPRVSVNNTFNRLEQPRGVLAPLDPNGAVITGPKTNNYNLDVGVDKTFSTGGTASMGVVADRTRAYTAGLPLNPETASAVDFALNQPLLQGAGFAVNNAPIVVARLDTERSFYRFKSGAQDLVRSVIAAYWDLVQARVGVWAREQQVEQGRVAYERAEGRQRAGVADAAEAAQARLAYYTFKANLITSQANLLERESALRNLLYLPATNPAPIIPTTPPAVLKLSPEWDQVLALAVDYRPEIVEQKLLIQAGEQRVLIANNQALPRLDAVGQYRWNALEGTTPTGAQLATNPGDYTDWTLGLQFSTPLGKRLARADLREQELILARERVNLEQDVHAATHSLANSVRRIDQYFEQYLARKETRLAARLNLEQQIGNYRAGRTIFLNVLLAITDWGNAISLEAEALTQYNSELANLERETGTILETHGISFYEEQFGSLGWLGRLRPCACRPARLPPTENEPRYESGTEPSEKFFDLRNPLERGDIPQLPPPTEPLQPGPQPQPTPGTSPMPALNKPR